jgi:hypothetical protein
MLNRSGKAFMKMTLVLVLCLAVFPSMAQADSGAKVSELIGWAQKAESDLEYDRAAEFWSSIIAHPEATQEEKVNASLHAGIIERVRGNRAEARDHFEYVLRRDIEHQLPKNTEPKIVNFFELIREELKIQGAPGPNGAAQTQGPSTTGSGVEGAGASGSKDWILFAAGGSAAILGAAALGASGFLALQMQELKSQAEAEQVQTARVDLYDEHDALLWPTNTLVGVGIGLVVLGAGLASLPLILGE